LAELEKEYLEEVEYSKQERWLSNNMDIKVVNQQGEEIKQEYKEVKEPETIAVKLDEYMLPSIASIFDLKPNEIDQYKEELKTLYEYAKTQTELRTPEALKWVIRSLQGQIGSPPFGERWITYLNRYVKLRMEKNKIEEEIKSFER
jgi:hypothetical protein